MGIQKDNLQEIRLKSIYDRETRMTTIATMRNRIRSILMEVDLTKSSPNMDVIKSKISDVISSYTSDMKYVDFDLKLTSNSLTIIGLNDPTIELFKKLGING